jgi:H+-transporting ATPase
LVILVENISVLENSKLIEKDCERLERGLCFAEVEDRRKQFGFNEVLEKKAKPWLQFVKRFWGLSAWLLEIIIVLSIFLQRYADVCIILGLLVLNAVLGFEEEIRASKAADA